MIHGELQVCDVGLGQHLGMHSMPVAVREPPVAATQTSKLLRLHRTEAVAVTVIFECMLQEYALNVSYLTWLTWNYVGCIALRR